MSIEKTSTAKPESISDLPSATIRAAFEQALIVSAVLCLKHTSYVQDMIVKKGIILDDFSKAVLDALSHCPPEGETWESGFFYEDFWAENLSESTPVSIRQNVSDRMLFVESEYLAPSSRFLKLLCQMQNIGYSASMSCSLQNVTFHTGHGLRDRVIVFGEGFPEKTKELLQTAFSSWMLLTEEFFYRFLCESVWIAQSLSFLFELAPGAIACLSVEEIRQAFPRQVKASAMRKLSISEDDFY